MYKIFKEEFVSFEELYEAYLDCRRKKRRSRSAVIFEMDWQSNLYSLYCELNSKKYKIKPYIVFCVDKPVKREIFAANFRDRIVHHLLINRLNSTLEKTFINDCYSCRKGRGTSYAVKRCNEQCQMCSTNYTKEAWILKGDFKSFFMTINIDILYSKLERFIFDVCYPGNKFDAEYTCWLIHTILYSEPAKNCIKIQNESHWKGLPKNKSLFNCNERFGLPIGNLTSQVFANFYLTDFDLWLTKTKGLAYYGRYVDDFYLVSQNKEELKNLIPQIRKELFKINVTLHPHKVYLQDIKKGVQFVGSVIKPNRIYITNRLKNNAFKLIKTIEDTNDEEILTHYLNQCNSYLGFMKNKATFKIRRSFCRGLTNKIRGRFLVLNRYQKVAFS